MNEQLQGAVAQILERAISGIDSSVEFMQAELPDVIEQLLLWYAVSNLIYALIGLLIMFGCYLVVKKPKKEEDSMIWEWSKSNEKHVSTDESIFAIFLLFPVALGLFMTANIMESIQIWIAPKIWLMEYAASLVK